MPTPRSNAPIFGRIASLRMSAGQRLRINAYMQDGELIAELTRRALENVRSRGALAGRAVKAIFARPARH